MSERTVGGRTIQLSNEDKVFFPDDGITKGDVVGYYAKIAETMLLHLEDRPVTMHRFPDGIEGKSFYQKNAPDYFPDWIERVEVEKESGTVHHVVCNDAATLVYLADQACLTPHVWLSRLDDLGRPDRMIFDLDPPGESVDVDELRFCARRMRELLEEVGLVSFLATTGSRGLHVVVPLRREAGFDAVRAFARDLAGELASRHDDRLTTEQRKAKRGGRLFLDTGRNARAQTAVAPYALRARPGAPVATPLEWDELGAGDFHPRRYTIENIFRRLGQRQDPWKGMRRHARGLDGPREAFDALLS